MTDNEMRIVIAEKCGELDRPEGQVVEYRRWDPSTDGVFERVKFPDGSVRPCYIPDLPNYPTDLNAMHSALMSQSPAFRARFETLMDNYCAGSGKLWCELRARDFAEVFLQTKPD